MITAQWRCALCGSYFEAIRDDFEEPVAGARAQPGPAAASIDEK
jgi:hypothetical protein